jgi:nucleoside-diphosphate-sugar epimerase
VAWGGAAVIEAAFKTARTKPPVFRRRLSWFATNRWFRIERAKRELGYQPRVPLAVGLARAAAWYRENGYLGPAMQNAVASARR